MKYKVSINVFFCFVLVTSITCKKEQLPKTIVEGVVSNKITGALVKNIPIEIIECDGVPQKCLTTIQTIYTDEKGYYSTSFQPDNRKSYKLALAPNNILANTPYPYYFPITKRIRNTVNFSQFPLKVLQLNIKVLRHDKNWLNISVACADAGDYFSYSCYHGENPTVNFDTTFHISIQAGRQYRAYVTLRNKTAAYTYIEQESLYKAFAVNNIDTTVVNFAVQ